MPKTLQKGKKRKGENGYLTNETISVAAIQTGDLLGWTGDDKHGCSDIPLKIIRAVINEDFGHVGVAVRMHDGLDDELMVVEATIPKIRIARLTTEKDFYCVPMGVAWDIHNKAFLMSKIGKYYGLMDAVRSAVGFYLENDDQWQCAELAYRFYEKSGIVMPPVFTPGKLIDEAIAVTGSQLKRVMHHGQYKK